MLHHVLEIAVGQSWTWFRQLPIEVTIRSELLQIIGKKVFSTSTVKSPITGTGGREDINTITLQRSFVFLLVCAVSVGQNSCFQCFQLVGLFLLNSILFKHSKHHRRCWRREMPCTAPGAAQP